MVDDWVCLKSNTLAKRLDADRAVGQFTDVTFIVGPNGNQTTFRAHKIILAAGSAVFETKLFGTKHSKIIKMADVHPKGFGNLIRYLYGVDVKIEDLSTGRETYRVAEKFKVDKLKMIAENNLIKLVKSGPISEIHKIAEEFDMPRLKERCLEIISSQSEEVSGSEDLFPKLAMEFTMARLKKSFLEIISSPAEEVYGFDDFALDSDSLAFIETILSFSQDRRKSLYLLPTIIRILAERKLPADVSWRILDLIIDDLIPEEFGNSFDIQFKSSVKSKIRAIAKEFSSKPCKSSKPEISFIKKNIPVVSPEIAISKDASHATKKQSGEEEVDQEKSELETENKTVADPETSEQSEKDEDEDDDDTDEDLIGADVVADVKQHVLDIIKDHMYYVAEETEDSFLDSADDVLQKASKTLQNVVDKALRHIEELTCKASPTPQKTDVDKKDTSEDV